MYIIRYLINERNTSAEIAPNGQCESTDSKMTFKRAFRCNNGLCLPRDQVCDINRDCPEGEDEDQDCGKFTCL